jgi:hypothetical protein
MYDNWYEIEEKDEDSNLDYEVKLYDITYN